ncbi:hypothetical protein SET4581_02126 [Salmonella enterica subsp. enterica serovar Typhimurium str. ST4581]|nr:hypothetical protein SET4581_02126 [Salmonella enterica subsp. enterica serovar Typhimurium str. ST4581]
MTLLLVQPFSTLTRQHHTLLASVEPLWQGGRMS